MYPPFLRQGSLVALAATARQVEQGELSAVIHLLQAAGYRTMLSNSIGKSSHQFAGTDAERLADLQALLDHPEVAAIWCARGGYGTGRIVDQLHYDGFVRYPKWLIGFSDLTVLLNDLSQRTQIATLHAPTATQVGSNTAASINSIIDLISGRMPLSVGAPPHPLNRWGKAQGVLVGGNLSLVCNSIGTRTDIDMRQKILLLEDLDEYLYHIDRLMLHLYRARKLADLAGLVVGSFTDLKDNAVPFGSTAQQIIAHYTAAYAYPLAFDFPIGHIAQHRAVSIGSSIQLLCSQQASSISSANMNSGL